MEISNDVLAQTLGRMEGKLDAHGASMQRLEGGMASLDQKLTGRLDGHDYRLRQLEVANPSQIALDVAAHEIRLRSLESGAAKAGVIAGVGSSVGIAIIIEIFKRKLGL